MDFIYRPCQEKTCLCGFVNNKGADQLAHPRRLISAFGIRFLKSIISNLATNEILIFWLVSVAEEIGLNLTLSKTPKTGYVATRSISRQTVQCKTYQTVGENCCGITSWLSPQCGVIAGNHWRNSQSSHCSPGLGGIVTNEKKNMNGALWPLRLYFICFRCNCVTVTDYLTK